MTDIISKINEIEDLDNLEGVSDEEIAEAEKTLGLIFAEEYREILLNFGCISFCGHDWTGLGFDEEGNVIDETKRERELNKAFPANMFVLENAGIDGIIIASDETGVVYKVKYDECTKLCDSISEYIDWCLNED